MKTTTPTLSAVLVLAALAAGCADDGDGGGDAAATITKEEWIAQANQICTKGDQEVEKAAQKAFSEAEDGSEADERAEQRFLEDVVAPNLEQQVAGVAALPRPEGDDEEIQGIIDAAQEGVQAVNADPSALEEEPDPFAEASRLMAQYGVTGCG